MTDPRNDNDHDTGSSDGSAGADTPDQLEGALEAAESALTRGPEVDYLLVADRAEVVNGKLYLMGGSWDRIQPQQFPHRMMLGIAIGVRIPFAYTDDQHTVAIELVHGEKRMIGFEAKLATGRPPGMAGMDMLVPMAFNIPIAIPEEGQVALKAVIDGKHGRRHDIKVIKRPGQGQQQNPPIQPA
ncbi:MAG: hypothetical protein AB1Z67_04320 [Candidatus Limnocylindrales bacterium]